MISRRPNPTDWVFVLLAVLVALMFILLASSYQSELGQAEGVPPPVPTVPLPVITSASIPVSTTPTFAPATVTALVQAHLTASVEQYGPSVPSPDEQVQEAEAIAYRSLYTNPGTLIAQGSNTVPTGELNLLTYRIEQVTLPGPTTFTRLTVGRTITVDRAWRVTITGGPFPVDNSTMYYLLVNGRMVVQGGNRTHELVFLVFDRGLLKEGARLGVSPGGTLPEALHFLP